MLWLRRKVNSPILPILTQKLVAMATSPELSGKGGQIPTNDKNLVKIGQVDPDSWDNIIGLKGFIFKWEVHADDLLKLRSYWTEVHQIHIQFSQVIADEHFNLFQNGDIAIRFGMPGLRIKVNSPILPILTLKLVTIANVPWAIEKGGQDDNLRSNTYRMVKIWRKSKWPSRTVEIWDLSNFYNHKGKLCSAP